MMLFYKPNLVVGIYLKAKFTCKSYHTTINCPPFMASEQLNSYLKKITPKQLAYLAAMSVAISLFFVTLFFNVVLQIGASIEQLLGLAVINGLICYGLFYWALEHFIYRRIKLIYKNIHNRKQTHGIIVDKVDMNNYLIDAVEDEVSAWATDYQSEIEQLKKLESYRREFIGNVSHELKTPIFALQGYLETLLDGGLYDEQINTKYIEKALKNAERLGSIVKDLETITQYEASVLRINWERFRIYDLCCEVTDEMERLAKTQNTEMLFKEGINRHLIVQADREKIRQVLNNLISNAVKYGKEKGKIWIGIYDMEKYVLLEVTDNGNGIAKEHLPRLFERFYRIDPSRSRHHGGAGLGLAIVKHIIEAHHQTIHVRSTVGKGTTFGFTLQKKKSL